MMSNNVYIIPLATFKQKSRQTNLWIVITMAFYGKGNTPFKNTQRHLESALRTPKFQTTHSCLHTQLWVGNNKKLDAKSSVWQHLKQQHRYLEIERRKQNAGIKHMH